MTSIRDLLKKVDPISHETPAPQDRDRVRRAMMAAAESRPPARPARARIAILAIAAAAAIAAAVGVRLWPSGATLHAAAVRFEIRLAEAQPTLDLTPARVAGTDRVVYLHREAIATNEDVTATRVVAGQAPQEFSVAIAFTSAAGEKMRAATASHIGRPVALILDDQVVMAPTVRSAIASEALLTGHYTYAEAAHIAGGMLVR